MKNCSDLKVIQSIRNVYPELEICFFTEEMLGTINVFTVFFPTAATLEAMWEDIYSTVAAYYQAGLSSDQEFEKWNIYIFYICRESVSRNLHYKIENDRYSCRKIVIDNCPEAVSDKLAERLTEQHITNLDLHLPDDKPEKPKPFKKDEQLQAAIATVSGSSQKKYTDEEFEMILKELERRMS